MASKVGFLLAGLVVAGFALWAIRSGAYQRNRDPSWIQDHIRRGILGALFLLGLFVAVSNLIALG